MILHLKNLEWVSWGYMDLNGKIYTEVDPNKTNLPIVHKPAGYLLW